MGTYSYEDAVFGGQVTDYHQMVGIFPLLEPL